MNEKMNIKNTILMILNQDFPDVRVCQEIKSLESNGFDVFLVISPLGGRMNASNYNASDFNLIQLPIFTSLFEKICFKFSFYNSRLLRELMSELNRSGLEEKIFAVHCHDLIWADFSHQISLKLNAKLIIDFHENFPSLVHQHHLTKTKVKQAISMIIDSPKRYYKYEEKAISYADRIIVVAEENGERLMKLGVSTKKVVLVSNTKDPDMYEILDRNYGEKINILYHGTVQRLRGLRTLIAAFSMLDSDKYHLIMVGFKKDCSEKKHIKSYIDKNNVKSVEMVDWLTDKEEMLELITKSDICVIPHERNELTETTVPNKIFEYMCHGKALIVSDVAPLKNIVKKSESGDVFLAGDAENLKCVISRFDKNLIKENGINARKAAETTFNWKADSNRLIACYQELQGAV